MCGQNPTKEILATCLYCWSEPEKGSKRNRELVWILWSMAVSTQMACKLEYGPLDYTCKVLIKSPLEMSAFACFICAEPCMDSLGKCTCLHLQVFVYYIVGSQIYCKFSSRTQKLSEYQNKASNTIFLFLIAYKSYVYAIVYEEQ